MDISIVVTAHNYGHYLEKALDSLYNQEFDGTFEVIVINDASTDNTKEVLSGYSSKHPELVVIHNETPRKLAGASNQGVDAAKGKYIVRFDADDLLRKDALQLLFDEIDNSDVGFVFPDYVAIDDNEDVKYYYSFRDHNDNLIGGSPMGSGGICAKEIALEIGGYDESLSRREDLDFWIRMRKSHGVKHLKQQIYLYRILPGTMSSAHYKRRDSQRDVYRKYVDENKLNSMNYIIVCSSSFESKANYIMSELDCVSKVLVQEVKDKESALDLSKKHGNVIVIDGSINIDSGHVLEAAFVQQMYNVDYVGVYDDPNFAVKEINDQSQIDENDFFETELGGLRLVINSEVEKESFITVFPEERN